MFLLKQFTFNVTFDMFAILFYDAFSVTKLYSVDDKS
jgi:hypothetical protein